MGTDALLMKRRPI
ncbi:hypothetical protein S40285_10907 [Stachybotrys chlorohalonatus IBT 40285]|uniref:Uncharacterized protein n=1 Tax=Stachybotrys chlorohalonatus (strain IBT 40285) TaxID=1283841 RepID=A0A084QYI1_STAC4|nr:hypothetical protein S40285_10907 [Stachybotrys chlorohalonata IBT 40285]